MAGDFPVRTWRHDIIGSYGGVVNRTERRMVEVLQALAENGALSVKAEFEAEGTRMDELLRLKDIASSAALPLTLKIGGCEALRDLFEAKQFGARYIVAPMVESEYALSKFISASGFAYQEDDLDDVDLLFNLETALAFENRERLLRLAADSPSLKGVVFGRVDYMGSMGKERDSVDSQWVTDSIVDVAKRCRDANLDLVVGGGVGVYSIPALRTIAASHLTRFETRKVVFGGPALSRETVEEGLLQAVHFELLWLMNKRDYYGRITHEDEKRIAMLEERWRVLDAFGQ